MKRFPAIQWILLIPLNATPFVLNVIFYQNGAMDDLFGFLPALLGCTLLNYFSCKKTVSLAILQVCIIGFVLISGFLSLHLYQNNMSNDVEGWVIGFIFIWIEVALAIGAAVGAVTAKAALNAAKKP